MASIAEKIQELEDEIRKTPYNKATQHHIGKLKAKLAKLKDDVIKEHKGSTKGFSVKKSGDASIGIVGYPSVGKSTLLNKLTNASSKTASYDFTTLDVIPGMMEYKGSKIQLLDLPGIVKGAAQGKGRGKEIISVLRSVNLLILMLDATDITKIKFIVNELEETGIRLNQKPPNVQINEALKGGVNIEIIPLNSRISEETALSIAREYFTNATIIIRENIDESKFIDALSKNRVYIPAILVVNKKDLVDTEQLMTIKKKIGNMDTILISAKNDENLDSLKEKIFQRLELMCIFVKPPHEDKSDEPMILKDGSTVLEVCKKIHKDFITNFRGAQVWGSSVEYPGQKVSINHKLKDGDIIRIYSK